MFGQVYFFDLQGDKMRCIGKTPVLEYWQALHIYAETPNPESQIISGNTVDEINISRILLFIDIINPKWIEELKQCL